MKIPIEIKNSSGGGRVKHTQVIDAAEIMVMGWNTVVYDQSYASWHQRGTSNICLIGLGENKKGAADLYAYLKAGPEEPSTKRVPATFVEVAEVGGWGMFGGIPTESSEPSKVLVNLNKIALLEKTDDSVEADYFGSKNGLLFKVHFKIAAWVPMTVTEESYNMLLGYVGGLGCVASFGKHTPRGEKNAQ